MENNYAFPHRLDCECITPHCTVHVHTKRDSIIKLNFLFMQSKMCCGCCDKKKTA